MISPREQGLLECLMRDIVDKHGIMRTSGAMHSFRKEEIYYTMHIERISPVIVEVYGEIEYKGETYSYNFENNDLHTLIIE